MAKTRKSRSSVKNIFREKQPMTNVEIEAVPRTMEDGEVVPTTILIPDTPRAFGENRSIVQMAEDVAGKHSQDDVVARRAGESAREQLEETDFSIVRRNAAINRIRAKAPRVWYAEVEDNAGVLVGHRMLFCYVDPRTYLEEVHERFISVEESMR